MAGRTEGEGTMAREDRLLTVSETALEALIEKAVQARIEGGRSQDPLSQRLEAAAQAQRLTETRYEYESPTTGNRFTAVVVASRAYPLGRIQTIEDIRHPDGIDRSVDNGGLVPRGMEIHRLDGHGHATQDLSNAYKTWRMQNYYLPDLIAFIGKPHQPYWLASEADKRRQDLARAEELAKSAQ